MTTYKRKKNTRMRAKTTHGYGSMKKNRGAGHRGGRGRAGSGKRGDVKKPSLMWEKGHKHKGKVGFKTYNMPAIKAINIATLEQKLPSYIEQKLVEKKGDVFIVDLKLLKFDKLLGTGNVTYKYEIKANFATEKALQKIEQAGGKMILPAEKVVEEPKKKPVPEETKE